MYGLIRQGQGKYYGSVIFGYYHDVLSEDRMTQAQELIKTAYYVVLDETKSRLIKVMEYGKDENGYPHLNVIITDTDEKGWILHDYKGGVKFLSREKADEYINQHVTTADILKKCQELDSDYHYEPYRIIKSKKDIVDLDASSLNFHDALITHYEERKDGSLYLLFDGTWDCKIEVIFSGDVKYNKEILMNPEPKMDYHWYDSSVLIKNGYTWLLDYSGEKTDDLSKEAFWFRGKEMKYHVIPD